MQKKILPRSLLILTAFSPILGHAELSKSQYIAMSGAVVSVGSSALISGLILSPVLLPVELIISSVEKSKENKTTILNTKTEEGRQVKLQVPENVVDEAGLKSGNKLTLEKAPEGTGALLKKDGKVISYMSSESDAGLSQNQTLTGAK